MSIRISRFRIDMGANPIKNLGQGTSTTDAARRDETVLMTGDQTVAGVKTFSSTPKMDAIAEKTADTGVTIDGVLIKNTLSASGIIPISGWIEVPNNSFYGWGPSNQRLTIVTNTSLVQKGDKIRLKQGGAYKYFYAISVDVGNSLIYVYAGNGYAMADGAVTDFAYSHVENPLGFPNYFLYTPVLTGSGTMGLTGTEFAEGKFTVRGNVCSIFSLYAIGDFEGTATNLIWVTYPITCAAGSFCVPCVIGEFTYSAYQGGFISPATGTKMGVYKFGAVVWSLASSTGLTGGQLSYII